MSAARCQNKIRLDFVIFCLNLLACRIKTAIQFLVSFFLMSNVSPFTRRVMNSWKTIQSCRTAQLFSMKRHVTWRWEADVCEYHFRGGWTASLPICQCVSEVRGEFLCVGVISISFVRIFRGTRSGLAICFLVNSWGMTESCFIKGSGEVERAEWIKAVLTPVRRALLV